MLTVTLLIGAKDKTMVHPIENCKEVIKKCHENVLKHELYCCQLWGKLGLHQNVYVKVLTSSTSEFFLCRIQWHMPLILASGRQTC